MLSIALKYLLNFLLKIEKTTYDKTNQINIRLLIT